MSVVVLSAVAALFWYVAAASSVFNTDVTQANAGYRTATIERRDIRSTVLATGVIRPQVGAEVRTAKTRI